MKNKNAILLRVIGILLLITTIIFYDRISGLIMIPLITLSLMMIVGIRNTEESTYNQQQRAKVAKTAAKGIKWTQSPILWMVIFIIFGGLLTVLFQPTS